MTMFDHEAVNDRTLPTLHIRFDSLSKHNTHKNLIQINTPRAEESHDSAVNENVVFL